MSKINPGAGGVKPVEVQHRRRAAAAQPGTDFDARLDRFIGESAQPKGEVRFSKHATARLDSRGLDVGEAEMAQLNDACDQLDAKGANEALVLTADRAYVVGVKQRTVITAMPRSEAMGTIFTNIDSTFIVD